MNKVGSLEGGEVGVGVNGGGGEGEKGGVWGWGSLF